MLLMSQLMRYLAILPQDRGFDGKHDWSAVRFCFDEQVGPLPRTHSHVQLHMLRDNELARRLFTVIDLLLRAN